VTGEGDHYFGVWIKTIKFGIAGSFKNRANLHLHDVGVNDAQADAAQAHHGVAFVHSLDNVKHLLFFCQAFGNTLGFQGGNFSQQVFQTRQEFVQRGIDQADDHWQTGHRLKESVEITAL